MLVSLQVLLKPIVSQLVVEPPNSLEEHSELPSVKEIDDLLVACIGQMAVTAGTDLLWKSLNHEVSSESIQNHPPLPFFPQLSLPVPSLGKLNFMCFEWAV